MLALCLVSRDSRAQSADSSLAVASAPVRELVTNYCLDCHGRDGAEGDLSLEAIVDDDVLRHRHVWEQVLMKLVSGQMPPSGESRPSAEEMKTTSAQLARILDSQAERHPHAGRTDTFRRLNRTEYRHAIRDLLALDIHVESLLPPDESSHGFDNVTVGDLPPTLLNRYVSAARKISKLAVGSRQKVLDARTYRVAADVTQEQHVPGLPLGTRGGTLIHHTFPRDGLYEVHVILARDRNEQVEGLNGKYQLEFLLDRDSKASLEVVPPKNKKHYFFDDSRLKTRFFVTAGPHDLGVTFVKNKASLEETKRQPLNVHFNTHRHPRLTPAVYEVSVTGPYVDDDAVQASAPIRDTPSRRRVFHCYPDGPEDEERCAEKIVEALARRAFRRSPTSSDLERLMEFYREARATADFDAGIEMALSAILVSPRFLLRVERDPPGLAAGEAYEISDLELATRMSFFLWSSLPDDALLDDAEAGRLREPEVLRHHLQRMLKDRRSESLVTNFGSQWLYLRNLDSKTPDGRLYPDFDDNLRQAFRRETELFLQSVIREDRSVLELLKADYTFLNERLAKHYGIPHIYGSRFRRVSTDSESRRGGLLRHGSILTVTSYATRTSPVIRGHWILENILGTPTPPPPPNVPSLDDVVIGAELPIRERLAEHRANPTCASCHDIMDPIGFALENYDAVGRWRESEAGTPIDARGEFADGSTFDGVEELEDRILARPELFVGAMTEKLLIYGLGRGVELNDRPTIRGIVRRSADDNYRFSSIMWAIINSPAFQMRMTE